MTEFLNGGISDRLKDMFESTWSDSVIRSRSSAALFAPELGAMTRPLLVTSNCGVGPKLRIAARLGIHDTVGRDCVALCVNDIICSGAKPLYYMAYVATDKTDDTRLEQIMKGITSACQEAGCAFFGGDRMEKSEIYADGKYDLSGFAVGVCDEKDLIDGHEICSGDILLGLSSSGLHNDGFDVVKHVFEPTVRALNRHIPELSCTLGEELLKPSAMYARPILYLTRTLGLKIKGMAHITAGGIFGNVPRMLPEGIRAHITPGTFPIPAIFDLISQRGSIPLDTMFHTFNMGTGLVMAIDKADVGAVYNALIQVGERPYMAGYCLEGERGVELSWQQI